MHKDLKQAYLNVREDHPRYPAQTAYRIARHSLVKRDYVLAPSPYLLGSRFSRGGLDISISCEYDHDADTSWLGEFTDKWSPNAVKHRSARTTGTYKYFVSETGPMDNYPYYHKGGYSKHQAWVMSRDAWLADYRRMVALNDDEWSFVGMTVKVSVGGIPLGEASLWGTEDDSEIYHFYDMADDLIHEAVEQAKQAAKGLLSVLGDMAFGEDKLVHKQEVGVA